MMITDFACHGHVHDGLPVWQDPARDTPILRQEPALDVVPQMKVKVTQIQRDATNPCVWQRRKLMNAIVSVLSQILPSPTL